MTEHQIWRLYWPDTGYSPLVETDFSGVMQREFIYFNGQKVALISSAGNPYYFLHDHLGSSSVMTSGTGLTVQAEYDFYPFGGERQITFQIDNRYRFTSYERDTESGNDYAVFRQYSNRLGRFMRADPLAGNILNPQSLNRFAYVLNNPGNLIDPLGLDTTCTTSPEGKTTCFTNVNEPGPNDGNRTLENVEAEVGRLPLCGSGGGDVCALILDFLNGNFGLGGWVDNADMDLTFDLSPYAKPIEMPGNSVNPGQIAGVGLETRDFLCHRTAPNPEFGRCAFLCEAGPIDPRIASQYVGMTALQQKCGPIASCPQMITTRTTEFLLGPIAISIHGIQVTSCVP